MSIELHNVSYTCIGIIGSRRRDSQSDFLLTKAVFDQVVRQHEQLDIEKVVIVSGGCPKGGDRFAEKIAKDYGLIMLIHHANWSKYGKRAGFVRNGDIAHDSDILIACVSQDRKGGTEDTVMKFGDKGPLIFV